MKEIKTLTGLFTPEEVSEMILAGDKLLLAGDAALLSRLPAGAWIGGSTPDFVRHPGNRVTSYDKIFVNRLPDYVTETSIKEYDETDIGEIFDDAPQNGFTALIMPYAAPVTLEYSTNATKYKNFATRPVCGWISGQPLEIILTEKAYTASGAGPCISSEKAIAMHVSLPENKYAEIHIYNLYTQGDGDSIEFDCNSFVVTDAIINGEKRKFADYLREINFDTLNPLVANYSGAMMNNVVYAIEENEVKMSAPVFKNVVYKIGTLDGNINEPSLLTDKVVLSVTCVNHFLQPDLFAGYIKKMNGPAVYGEIAYQHICLTTVYLTIEDVIPNTQTT